MVRDQGNQCVTKLNKKSTTRYYEIHLYAKDPFRSMYKLLIKGREKVGFENLKNP